VVELVNYVLELSEEQAFVAVLARHGWTQHGFAGNVISDLADFVDDLMTSLPVSGCTVTNKCNLDPLVGEQTHVLAPPHS